MRRESEPRRTPLSPPRPGRGDHGVVGGAVCSGGHHKTLRVDLKSLGSDGKSLGSTPQKFGVWGQKAGVWGQKAGVYTSKD